jgi:hypothetical protein
MKPVITIHDYEPWMPDLLFPFYKEGWFKGFEEGLEIDEFARQLNMVVSVGINKFYLINYNGNVVCLMETRRIPGSVYWETYTHWFTRRRKKKILSICEFLEHVKNRDILAMVDERESKGYMDLTDKGLLRYMGEQDNVCVFVNR